MTLNPMTSLDVFAFFTEFKNLLPCKIVNIYQNKNVFNFKLRCKGKILNLLMEPSIRVHITSIERSWEATNTAMILRRHLRNKTITEINQIEFDRILRFHISGGYRLYLEILNRGNLVLTKDNRIIFSTRYVEMRDRIIKPNHPYIPPPNSPVNPLNMDKEVILEKLNQGDLIIKSLIRLGIGKKYAIELLYRSKIDEKTPPLNLDESKKKIVVETLISLLKQVKEGKMQPVVYLNENGEPVEYSPIPLKIMEIGPIQQKIFITFNEALDFYYSTLEVKESVKELSVEKELEKMRKRIEQQEKLIEEYMQKAEKYRTIGALIYEKLPELNEIIEVIRRARKEKNIPWYEISKKIEEGKKAGIKEAQLIKKITKKGQLVIALTDNVEIQADISTDFTRLADKYFEKAKKLEKKREKALLELEKSKREYKRLSSKRADIKKEKEIIIKMPPRKWFHQFRWFFTTNDYLVVAGKDAESNERLVKNYMEEKDLFLHAEIHGAPATIIKNGRNLDKSSNDVLEAAIFAASYSSAWKQGYSAVDVFWCFPEDVSLTPPSGMYLAKGSFIIKQKNYLRNVPLKLTIGLKVSKTAEEIFTYEVLVGPPDTIKAKTNIHVTIVPGKIKKSEIAKMIVSALKKKAGNNLVYKKILESIKIDRIIEIIPGPSELFNERE